MRTVRPKQTRTLTLLGYTHETLFEIVGTKPEGNYHLDHSIPLSWMVSTTPPSIACHLDNLSWITEKDNLAKNNIYSNPVSESYFNTLKTYIKPDFINRFIITDGVVHDVKKDFDHAFIGIKMLPIGCRLGVYTAYIYYLKLLEKIEEKYGIR